MSTNFNAVTPLQYWCQSILPLVYDDSLSYMELLSKVVLKLNELIANNEKIPSYIKDLILSNPAIAEILMDTYDTVKHNITVRDVGLNPHNTEAIATGEWLFYKNVLYYASRDIPGGSLLIPGDNIIEKTIESFINDYAAEVDTKIAALETYTDNEVAAMKNTVNNSKLLKNTTGAFIYPVIEIIDSRPGYSGQGMCVDGNITFVAFAAHEGSPTKIVKYVNGAMTAEINGNYYHANSMCLGNGELFVAECLEYTSSGATLRGGINIFDADTLAFKRAINTGLASFGVTGIGYSDGKLYAISNNRNVYTVDIYSGVSTYYCTLDLSGCSGTPQGGFVDSDTIYHVFSNPNYVALFNRDGSKKNVLNIPVRNNSFLCEELEAVCVNAGKIYLGGCNGTFSYYGVFVANSIGTEISSWNGRSGMAITTLIADGAENTAERMKNGTFKTVAECLQKIKALPIGKYEITMQANDSSKIVLESMAGTILRIGTRSNVYSGEIFMYDGELSFEGNYDLISYGDTKITMHNYNAGTVKLSMLGSLTNGGVAATFINVTSGSAEINLDCTFPETLNPYIKLNDTSRLNIPRRGDYVIENTGTAIINSNGFVKNVVSVWGKYTQARIYVSLPISNNMEFNMPALVYGAHLVFHTDDSSFDFYYNAPDKFYPCFFTIGTTFVLAKVIYHPTTSQMVIQFFTLSGGAFVEATGISGNINEIICS